MAVAYPHGTDYEWLALDCEENLARFTTGGRGPIPTAVLYHSTAIESALALLYQLPLSSKAELIEELPCPDDFVKIAELGLFGYDWRDVHRAAASYTNQYEPISIPTAPAESLPAEIVSVASLVTLSNLSFSSSTNVDIESIVRCVRAA